LWYLNFFRRFAGLGPDNGIIGPRLFQPLPGKNPRNNKAAAQPEKEKISPYTHAIGELITDQMADDAYCNAGYNRISACKRNDHQKHYPFPTMEKKNYPFVKSFVE